MKITYIIGSLATQGGTAKMVIEKANLFTTYLGYDVTIITMVQHHNEPNTYLLSKNIKQYYLEIPLLSIYKYKYLKRVWAKRRIYKSLRNKLIETVQSDNPDILIGISHIHADLISTIKCNAKKVIECHEVKKLTHSYYGIELPFLYRLYNSFCRFKYFYTIERNANVICTLTEGEQKLWNKARRVEVIPNFTTMHVSQFSNYTTKRIIAVGRIEWEKGYSRLIKIWEIVYSRHPDWRLDIYGEGSLKKTIETIINSNSIKNLKIHQFTHNISQEFANSSICVVTSYYESFSLVLLEAMKHGVPCVAFDCPFGPGSIIQDGYNGFLIENGDCNLFAERLCNLIEDTKLREYFSGTSIRHAKLYDVKGIIDKWDTLFKSIL